MWRPGSSKVQVVIVPSKNDDIIVIFKRNTIIQSLFSCFDSCPDVLTERAFSLFLACPFVDAVSVIGMVTRSP